MAKKNEENAPQTKGKEEPKHAWLKTCLKATGNKQVDLARALDLQKNKVTKMITGERAAQLHEIPVIANMTGLTVYEVIQRFASSELELMPEPGGKSITVRGEVQAGDWRSSLEWDLSEWEVITMPKALNYERSYGLKVVGNSMNKHYPSGSVIICVPFMDYTKPVGDGDHVIVERSNKEGLYEATVKEIQISDDGKIWLVPKSTDPSQTAIELNNAANRDEWFGTDSDRITGVVVGSVNVNHTTLDGASRKKLLPA